MDNRIPEAVEQAGGYQSIRQSIPKEGADLVVDLSLE